MTRTSVSHPPFHNDCEPDKLTDASTLQDIQAYALAFWGIPSSDRADFASKKTDNNFKGRHAWAKWVSDGWKKWKVNDVVDRILVEAGSSPHDLMRYEDDHEVCRF